jgi:hypothetical protein
VRRARATGTRRTALHREAIAFERESEAQQHSRAITKWLDENGVAVADREQVTEKTRLFLSVAEGTWQLPPADKTVRMRRPAQPDPSEIGIFAGFARQLALWVSAGIADIQVRQRALELACDEPTTCLVPAA